MEGSEPSFHTSTYYPVDSRNSQRTQFSQNLEPFLGPHHPLYLSDIESMVVVDQHEYLCEEEKRLKQDRSESTGRSGDHMLQRGNGPPVSPIP
jgi:hypothetical protein